MFIFTVNNAVLIPPIRSLLESEHTGIVKKTIVSIEFVSNVKSTPPTRFTKLVHSTNAVLVEEMKPAILSLLKSGREGIVISVFKFMHFMLATDEEKPMLNTILSQLATSTSSGLCAVLNILPLILKQSPSQYASAVIHALIGFYNNLPDRTALTDAAYRNVEKTLKNSVAFILRTPKLDKMVEPSLHMMLNKIHAKLCVPAAKRPGQANEQPDKALPDNRLRQGAREHRRGDRLVADKQQGGGRMTAQLQKMQEDAATAVNMVPQLNVNFIPLEVVNEVVVACMLNTTDDDFARALQVQVQMYALRIQSIYAVFPTAAAARSTPEEDDPAAAPAHEK